MKRFLFIISLLSLPASAGSAIAMDMSGYQPPAPFGVFSTATADSPEPMQSAVSFTFEKVGEPDFKRYSTQLAMGITRNIEFGVNIPYVDDSVEQGIEDITFSIKHRFFEEGNYGPSAAYILTGAKSSNNEQYSTDGGYGGGLIASKRIGPLQVHANVLYTDPNQEGLLNDIRGSLGFIFAADHNFNLLAELIARKSYLSRSLDQAEARIGYRFLYANRVYSTLGVALGIDDKGPDYRILLSISLLFPKKKISVEALD